MAFIMNAWYVVAWPNEVTAEQILVRTICGLPMVFWRGAGGALNAIEDRCPHREMPLSQGRLENGTIRCSYHGLRFAGDGACVEIPGQERIPPTVCVRHFPIVQKHGWVWVWPGDLAKADPELIPESQARNDHPDWACSNGTSYVRGNYQLITDNLLDLTHETFLHATSLGNQAVVENPMETRVEDGSVTVSRWMIDHEPAPFWKAAIKRSKDYDGHCDRWQIIHFVPPANLVLDVGVAPTGTGAPEGDRSRGVPSCNLNAITPETETTTWMFWTLARNFQQDNAELTKLLQARAAAIIEEDRVAIEAVQQVMDRNPGRRWISLGTDTGGVAARRIVERLIETERTSA
jgi:vanillate O-demethylase monooxygenase subunit